MRYLTPGGILGRRACPASGPRGREQAGGRYEERLQMTLAELFHRSVVPPVPHVPTDRALGASVSAALALIAQQGQSSWPQLQIPVEQFIIFLAQVLPPEARTPERLAALHARDLYLVCGFTLGHPAAQVILETEYMPRVHRALLQDGTPEAMIADIQQGLCRRLVEQRDPGVARQGYSGRGELAGWLCTCAVHESRRQQQRARRELPLEQAPQALGPHGGQNPESELLTKQLKAACQDAFREAVATLTPRERNLLRYHSIASLSLEQIAVVYKVHRATAARWLAQAHERLREATRARFLQRVQVSPESLPDVMALIQSQISLQMAGVLAHAAERESMALRRTQPWPKETRAGRHSDSGEPTRSSTA